MSHTRCGSRPRASPDGNATWWAGRASGKSCRRPRPSAGGKRTGSSKKLDLTDSTCNGSTAQVGRQLDAEMMAALRQVLHRPAAPPSPAPLVRLDAAILRTDPALALTGRRCVPTRLTEAGFVFSYPELRPALEDLFG